MQTTPCEPAAPETLPIDDPAALGAAIRHHRLRAELTQEELAARVGIHRSYLSELERGKGTEQLTRVLAVLRELGVGLSLGAVA